MHQTIPRHPIGDWPESGLETLGHCPVCQSPRRSVLHEHLRDNVFFCAPGSWTLWRCEGCRSAYLDPRPTAETIHLAYSDYYTHAAPIPAQEAKHLSAPRILRRALANGYRNWRYGTDYRPARRFGIAAALASPSLRRVIDVAFRHLPHPADTSGRRVLDVGFGNGAFIDLAASAGWEAFGCDPDPVAVENSRARGLNVRQGGIEAWADAEGSFDAMTLSHVLEHVHDPAATIRAAYRLLRPGGQLYIDTPNIDALGHEEYGPFWLGLDPPRHLVLFHWRSVTRLLVATGFRAIQRRTYSVMARSSLARARLASGFPASGEALSRVAGASLSLRMRSRLARRRSEYVTLICRKPR